MKKWKIVGLLLLAAFTTLMVFKCISFSEEPHMPPYTPHQPPHYPPDLPPPQPYIPPAWYQTMDTRFRFKLVMNGDAVLDKETGLVWERAPSNITLSWHSAVFWSYNIQVGGRKGWRLPTAEELASLVDDHGYEVGEPPYVDRIALPEGHPFVVDVKRSVYWTATTYPIDASYALAMDFSAWIESWVGPGFLYGKSKSTEGNMWLVRGGHGYDAY